MTIFLCTNFSITNPVFCVKMKLSIIVLNPGGTPFFYKDNTWFLTVLLTFRDGVEAKLYFKQKQLGW